MIVVYLVQYFVFIGYCVFVIDLDFQVLLMLLFGIQFEFDDIVFLYEVFCFDEE